jgi:hypothetical protein
LQRKEKALAEATAYWCSEKKPMRSGGKTRKADLVPGSKRAVELICEAHSSDTRYKVCVQELGISLQSFERRRKEGNQTKDKRCNPRGALSDAERQEILNI